MAVKNRKKPELKLKYIEAKEHVCLDASELEIGPYHTTAIFFGIYRYSVSIVRYGIVMGKVPVPELISSSSSSRTSLELKLRNK